MTPEGKVKAKIIAVLKARQPKLWYFMPVMGGRGVAGVPDFIGCYRGVMFGVEAKAGNGRVTALQNAQISRIRAARGHVIVVNEENVGQLGQWLDLVAELAS